MSRNQLFSRIENRILSSMPSDDLQRMMANMDAVPLSAGKVLYELHGRIDYVYFIESGMVSLVSLTEEGGTFEVGLVCHSGMVGATAFLDSERSVHRTIVQSAGTALRMKVSAFKTACEKMASLQGLVRRYCSALISQVTQAAVCCRFHTTEARLCRWLLQTRDCMKSNTVYLTQDILAEMLGVYRPAVTLAARVLQSAGLIKYRRGQITIVDRQGLEASACECYRTIAQSIDLVFSG